MPVHGVSIEIPEPWGSQLQQQREDVGDPMARAIPPHVTLMPPTEVAEGLIPEFTTHLRDVARDFAPFDMILRGAAAEALAELQAQYAEGADPLAGDGEQVLDREGQV